MRLFWVIVRLILVWFLGLGICYLDWVLGGLGCVSCGFEFGLGSLLLMCFAGNLAFW